MGQPVWTKLGYCVDDDLLELLVTTEIGPNYHKVVQTWTMRGDLYVDGQCVAKAGEVMKQDAVATQLAGVGMGSVQGKLG